MGLIFRSSSLANTGATQVKNSALTYQEGDGNFAWLATNLSGSAVSITGSTSLTGSLTVSNKIGVNNPSPAYSLDVFGTFRTTGVAAFGDNVAFKKIVNLESQNPLPSGTAGDLAVSSSISNPGPASLYFYDGTQWREIQLI